VGEVGALGRAARIGSCSWSVGTFWTVGRWPIDVALRAAGMQQTRAARGSRRVLARVGNGSGTSPTSGSRPGVAGWPEDPRIAELDDAVDEGHVCQRG
jgi:hypothetical protein